MHTYHPENYYRTFARIRLDAIETNFSRLKENLQPGVKALAVVKADAYGHGSVPVATRLEPMADYFGVATLDEAITLREGGIQKPILILSYTTPLRFSELIEYGITATLYREEDAILLSEEAQRLGKTARAHLAVDTGMGRIGFAPTEESAETVARIVRLPALDAEGIFSHYACADCADKTDASCQTAAFDDFLARLSRRGVNFAIRHLCNSAGGMEWSPQYDMCRFGIAIYGIYPSQEVERRIPLIPAMEVVSHVIYVKEVEAGTKIGYGHIYTAPSRRRIATVCIGYADGFNRCLTGVGYLLIRGKKAPLVGRVCMDQIMVDVTEVEGVAVGDEAVVLGRSENAEITAEELGELSHSFPYEVLCNFMPRVTRIYPGQTEKKEKKI